MNGIIETIKCLKGHELLVDCGDSCIIINKRGSFNNKPHYSWTYIAPTSGLDMVYKSQLVTQDEILMRIALTADGPITTEQGEAVKLFFGN